VSIESMAIVLHHSKAKGTDKLILLGIANHAGDGGAWPALATLARYANVSENSARLSLRRLEAIGEVVTHLRAGGLSTTPSWSRPNRYDVVIACPATCDRTSNHRLAPTPQAPADLWIDPPSPTRGPLAHEGRDPSPTRGEDPSPTRGEPSIEPPINNSGTSPASTTDRASAARAALNATCSECSLPEAECQRRTGVSGHTFTPRKPS